MRTPMEKETVDRLRDLMHLYFHEFPGMGDMEKHMGKVKLYWDDRMDDRNGILGSFRAPDRISLPLAWKEREKAHTMDLKEMLPTLYHELVHYETYMRTGRIVWYMSNCPLWKRWLTEPPAHQMQAAVEKYFGYNYEEEA